MKRPKLAPGRAPIYDEEAIANPLEANTQCFETQSR